jgi:hypothetical protein
MEFENVFYLTLPGSDEFKNHDFIWVGRNIAMVLDGATPLDGNSRVLKRFMMDFVEGLANTKNNKTLPELVKEVLANLKDYEREEVYRQPSFAASIIRQSGKSLEIAVYGDVYTVVSTRNEIIEMVDENIVKMDEKAIKLLVSYIKEGLSRKEALGKIKDLLIKHRSGMCERYTVIAPMVKCYKPCCYHKIPLEEVRKVVAMSDGFWERVKKLGLLRDIKSVINLPSREILGLVNEIFEWGKNVSFDEPFEMFYPLDDASVLVLEL